jgi:hypothetical protein
VPGTIYSWSGYIQKMRNMYKIQVHKYMAMTK